MKKIVMLCLGLILVLGCSSSIDNVKNMDIKGYLKQEDDSFEILDVDDKYLYINTYEHKEGLLYDSQNVLVLNHEGELVKNYDMLGDFRVLDFIIWNDIPYYMTLIKDNNEYICELIKVNNDVHVPVNQWVLKDPYNYPTFHMSKERVFYRVDNYLYSLDALEPFMDDSVQWLFGLEEPHEKTVSFKAMNEEGIYEVFTSSNEGEPIFAHEYIGEFYLDKDQIIFNSRNNFKLYSYNLNTKKIKCIYDGEIDDFEVGHDYIGVSMEKEIVIYDKHSFKEICTIHKDKYNINPIEYIYVIENDFYVVSENKNVIKIGVES